MHKIENEYQKREKLSAEQISTLAKRSNHLSRLRLLTFLCSAILAVLIYIFKMLLIFYIGPVLLFILFIGIVIIHSKVENKKEYTSIIHKINQESLSRLTNEWRNFTNNGVQFFSDEHVYSEDLDIFGPSSLYQLINTAESYLGKQKLKDTLLNPHLDYEEILKKQAAISELASKIDWRQSFQAHGRKYFKDQRDPESIIAWSTQKDKGPGSVSSVVLRLLPIFSIAILVINYALNLNLFFLTLFLPAIHIILLIIYYKRLVPVLTATEQYKSDIQAYAAMLSVFEKETFTSPLLQEKQNALRSVEGHTTSEQVKKLTRIIEMSNIRYSSLYIIYDIITLWDIQILISLEKWKKSYGIHIRQWLNVLAEVEMLASLSNLNCNKPGWCLPQISNKEVCIRARALGHPLLDESTIVANDIDIKRSGTIQVITGSNMSGKSTWLRTIGINLVLAYNGTVNCAAYFQCSLFNIFSVMRVKDNLEKKLSSFYAELLKIKYVIDQVRANVPVFFLFDEIFKGTNSIDRHIGAKVLIQFLSRQGAVGLVSTHDLVLGNIANEDDKIENYHFEESYENGNIKYHYKLLPGISKSRNAIYLMKMAGLKIDDDILQKIEDEFILKSVNQY
jgi:DNA mismatch repair ATPase MutS